MVKMEADNMAGGKEPRRLPVWACIPLFIVILFILLGFYGTLARGCLSLMPGGVEACQPGVMGYIILEASMLLAVFTAALPMLRLERRPFSDLGLSLRGHVKGLWYGFLMAILLYLSGSHRFPVRAVRAAGIVGVFPAGRLVRRNTDARLYPRTPAAHHHE